MRAFCVLALLACAAGCSAADADEESSSDGQDNLTLSSANCTINDAPAKGFYDQLLHGKREMRTETLALTLHRSLSLSGRLSTKLGDKVLAMDIYLLADGNYIGGYSEGHAAAPDRTIRDAAVVLRGTWKVECEKIRLSGLGLAEPFAVDKVLADPDSKEHPGIRVTMERDLISPGLSGTPRVLLRSWDSTGPDGVANWYSTGGSK